MIKDPYGRPVTSLRVSITHRCNLRCFYCHWEGQDYNDHSEMTPKELQRIVGVAASFNVRKSALIEHLRCGYIDTEDRLHEEGKLVCPKCKRELVSQDTDHRKAGIWRQSATSPTKTA